MNKLTKIFAIIIIILGITVSYLWFTSTNIQNTQPTIIYLPSNVTALAPPDTSLVNLFFVLLSLSVVLIIGIFIYIIIRKGYISLLLKRSYIEVYIIGKDRRIRRYKKVIRNIESKLTPVINKRKYLMIDRLMFISRNNPSWIYREGNPKPLEISDNVFDVKISDSELNDAIESKVVADLLKLSYVGLEKIMMILIIATIGLSIITLYYAFNINSNVSAIIDYLISQQSNPTDAVIVPNIP